MIDLPQALKRKPKYHKPESKRQKGTSIDERPVEVKDRMVFGHWEGDLVVGGNYQGAGALLTLVERMTRQLIAIPLKAKTAKQVYMAINKLERYYGFNLFKNVFKTITFDNGSEFSRFNDLETSIIKPKEKRTTIFFAHPYAAFERGSNENCNRLIRVKIPKGKCILKLSKENIAKVIAMINNKRRKINNYQSSQLLFEIEIEKIKQNF